MHFLIFFCFKKRTIKLNVNFKCSYWTIKLEDKWLFKKIKTNKKGNIVGENIIGATKMRKKLALYIFIILQSLQYQ